MVTPQTASRSLLRSPAAPSLCLPFLQNFNMSRCFRSTARVATACGLGKLSPTFELQLSYICHCCRRPCCCDCNVFCWRYLPCPCTPTISPLRCSLCTALHLHTACVTQYTVLPVITVYSAAFSQCVPHCLRHTIHCTACNHCVQCCIFTMCTPLPASHNTLYCL